MTGRGITWRSATFTSIKNLNEGRYPAMVYSGSLERIDFGEEKEAKGFCWVELEKGNTTWQFVEVNARPFVTISLDVREEDDPTLAAQARTGADTM